MILFSSHRGGGGRGAWGGGGGVFFQAEDGIRDLVRSRGLGDVYKRQALLVDCISDRKNYFAISKLKSVCALT